jgi:hypothetical protein
VLNLSNHPASVTANYMRDDGIRLTQWFGVEPGARLAIGAQEIVVERISYFPGWSGFTTVGAGQPLP